MRSGAEWNRKIVTPPLSSTLNFHRVCAWSSDSSNLLVRSPLGKLINRYSSTSTSKNAQNKFVHLVGPRYIEQRSWSSNSVFINAIVHDIDKCVKLAYNVVFV